MPPPGVLLATPAETLHLSTQVFRNMSGGEGEEALFRADFDDPGNNFGFAGAGETNNAHFTKTHLSTGGPSGGGALRYEHHPLTIAQIQAGSNNPQYYCGYASPSFASISQGESFFYRIYVKPVTLTNPDIWHAATYPAEDIDDNAWSTKWSILPGDPQEFERMISDLGFFSSSLYFKMMRGVDGFPFESGGPLASVGSWHSYQVEIETSSVRDAVDGMMRVWLDTDVYGSPSTQSTEAFAINVPAAGWTTTSFNEFCHSTLAGGQSPTPSVIYDIGAFEVGETFDAGWFDRMT